jgi:hypothetical protein
MSRLRIALVALVALLVGTVAFHRRRRQIVPVPQLEPAIPYDAKAPASDDGEGRGLGWTLVVLACTAVVAAGALAVAIRTALWPQPTTAVAASPAEPEEASPGLQISDVAFVAGELRFAVSNPQSSADRISLVTVDDAIVAFHTNGTPSIEANGSRQVVVHYDWVPGQPVHVGVTTGSGIESTADAEAPAA